MTDAFKKWYPALLALLGALASAAVYPRLPDTIAVHWDLWGNPDGWMPRSLGAFALPILLLVVTQLLRMAPRINPREGNSQRFSRTYEIVTFATSVLLLATHGIVLATALGPHLPMRRLVPALGGVLYLAIGDVMPRTKANRWFGVRTRWTLSSDRVWMRTHRLAGHSMVGAGIVMITGALVPPSDIGAIVSIAAAVAAIIAPTMYSYLTWRREPHT